MMFYKPEPSFQLILKVTGQSYKIVNNYLQFINISSQWLFIDIWFLYLLLQDNKSNGNGEKKNNEENKYWKSKVNLNHWKSVTDSCHSGVSYKDTPHHSLINWKNKNKITIEMQYWSRCCEITTKYANARISSWLFNRVPQFPVTQNTIDIHHE